MKRVITLLAFVFLCQTILSAQNIRTVGSGGDYTTLKAAFDAINAGLLTGNVVLQVRNNTNESATAILNASGTGSASYSSVLIYPIASGKTISGNLAGPLIDLNGADNVTIDGRVDQTGPANLSISNSNTTANSTIRFINDATDNIVRFSFIRGSSTSASSGVVLFSTGTVTGNDNNIIEFNNITNIANTSRPVHGIASFGSAGSPNSGIAISGNNIYDYCVSGSTSYGTRMDAGTTDCIIDGNSFYDTNFPSVSTNNAAKYGAIYLNNISGSFDVRNNFIGGNAPSCTGTWLKSNASVNDFTAIEVNTSNAATSSLQGNVIRNFNWANASSRNGNWIGILVTAGRVNLGTESGNTIGDAGGNGSITFTGSFPYQEFNAIRLASGAGVVDCRNNLIASITCANSSGANATSFFGIYSLSSSNTIIHSNTIGSLTQANSINASSTSTSNAQSVHGIFIANTNASYDLLIEGNTVANISNATTFSNTSVQAVLQGITSQTRLNRIINNVVMNLSIAKAGTDGTVSPTCGGIVLNSLFLNGNIIRGNEVSGLRNSNNSFSGNVIGILYRGGTTRSTIANNFVHSLSAGPTAGAARVSGILITEGLVTVANSIISVGGSYNAQVYGIYDIANGNFYYFNTVHACGTASAGSGNSFALFAGGGTQADCRNNIFYNSRSNSGATAKHYAIGAGSAIGAIDFNNYYAFGTGGVLGVVQGIDKVNLTDWRGGSVTKDLSSLSVDPDFFGSTVSYQVPNPDFFINGSTESLKYNFNNRFLVGTAIGGYDTDFNGTTRFYQSMGALEYNALLPVSWLSFNGYYDRGVVQLHWSTGNEKNNARFEVERSLNARAYTTLGTVKGAGSSSSTRNYGFTDRYPVQGKSYYRIRQVDIDGRSTISAVVSIELKQKLNISVSPNPVKDQMQVTIPLSANSSFYILQVNDIKGNLIMSRSIKPGITMLDVNRWATGTYLVNVWDNGGKIYSRRIVK